MNADTQPAAPGPACTPLPGRTLLALTGADATGFLDPLVSNDVTRVVAGQAVYAALLSPQGKFLHDFLITARPDGGLLLDVDAARCADLARRLTLYRLRAKVGIDALPGWSGFAAWGAGPPPRPAGSIAFADPRLPALGWRLWLPPDSPAPAVLLPDDAYDRHRIALGVPDGARDIEIDKGLLLEHHFEALNGVDFNKGCYIGQELTARTKYRGLVKKQLYRVAAVDGVAPLPPAGTAITLAGAEVGRMGSSTGAAGLALLRLDSAGQGPLDCAGIALAAARPDYAGPAPEPKAG